MLTPDENLQQAQKRAGEDDGRGLRPNDVPGSHEVQEEGSHGIGRARHEQRGRDEAEGQGIRSPDPDVDRVPKGQMPTNLSDQNNAFESTPPSLSSILHTPDCRATMLGSKSKRNIIGVHASRRSQNPKSPMPSPSHIKRVCASVGKATYLNRHVFETNSGPGGVRHRETPGPTHVTDLNNGPHNRKLRR